MNLKRISLILIFTLTFTSLAEGATRRVSSQQSQPSSSDGSGEMSPEEEKNLIEAAQAILRIWI